VVGDKTVKVWDVMKGEVILTFRGHDHWVVGAAFSADGKRVVSTSWDRWHEHLKVWDAATGRIALALDLGTGPQPPGAVFSPDGKRLAAVLDRTVLVWDAERDQQFARQRWSRWHQDIAQECEDAGKWFAAAFQLGRLVEAKPSDAPLRARRARVLGELRQVKAP
jgi:hypothetical protein